ncbi:MAG TPA: GNAT family N-acetyltransferase [Casimicrobiaceae bacterium]
MADTGGLDIAVHDGDLPPEAETVDAGLGAFNDAAAPLHEVRRLACIAREGGEVVGGAVGRRWGRCGEIQQLWVAESHRGRGIGSQLVRAFEQRAAELGVRHFYLETLSFQAPGFYETLGYRRAYALDVYPHGYVKYLMRRDLDETG